MVEGQREQRDLERRARSRRARRSKGPRVGRPADSRASSAGVMSSIGQERSRRRRRHHRCRLRHWFTTMR